MRRTITVEFTPRFNADAISADDLTEALENLLDTALSTPGILPKNAEVDVGPFNLMGETIPWKSQCSDHTCRGWIHSEGPAPDGGYPCVERCDTCARFGSDEDALDTHNVECSAGIECRYARLDTRDFAEAE
jgi:hypothetical protein